MQHIIAYDKIHVLAGDVNFTRSRGYLRVIPVTERVWREDFPLRIIGMENSKIHLLNGAERGSWSPYPPMSNVKLPNYPYIINYLIQLCILAPFFVSTFPFCIYMNLKACTYLTNFSPTSCAKSTRSVSL